MTEENEFQNPPMGEILLYQTEDGNAKVECRFANENLWLTQALMAELFDVSVKTINEHLINLYSENELSPEATIRKFRIVRLEGNREVSRLIDHYNLDAIFAVGYRVRGNRGVQFRRWASDKLSQFLISGFIIDNERLKNPPQSGLDLPDRFDDLLEQIRDIRASEARMYLRVREIFAMAADYGVNAEQTQNFFQHIQNRLHFAVTGKTAAEIIKSRANHQLPNMGLTNFKGKNVTKKETETAKNYLNESEISELNRITNMWLDFAEDQVLRRKEIFMSNWEERLDEFLRFNDRNVLSNRGAISHKSAISFAHKEYEKHSAIRRQIREAEGEKAIDNAIEIAAKTIKPAKDRIKK